uniref:zinc ribbon domain-containing protein n=1 Tax=Agathobacter sp. TaxID=2021311 RepID=UPI0040565B41
MAFNFNKVKEGILSAGKEVESFAKDASAIAKIKYDIHTKEDFLEKQYALLGKAFYNAHKDEEVEESVYFAPIAEAEEALANLKADLLAAQGAKECPSCGAKQAEKHDFCSSCGASLKKAEDDIVADVIGSEDEVVEEEAVFEEEAASEETVVLDEK